MHKPISVINNDPYISPFPDDEHELNKLRKTAVSVDKLVAGLVKSYQSAAVNLKPHEKFQRLKTIEQQKISLVNLHQSLWFRDTNKAMFVEVESLKEQLRGIASQMGEEALVNDCVPKSMSASDARLFFDEFVPIYWKARDLTTQINEIRKLDWNYPDFNRAEVEQLTEKDLLFLNFARKYNLPLPPVRENEPVDGRLF